jgi:ABC-type Fe3+-hydroxamate transport system substrate-binding protein
VGESCAFITFLSSIVPDFIDQLGRKVYLSNFPKRIISLVPSQTELLFDLGLEENVVGITKFCVHPNHWFRKKRRVGGTKNLNIEVINAIGPDLIIANKEENVQEHINKLAESFPVWVSDVQNLKDALDMMENVGKMTGKISEATELIKEIRESFFKLKNNSNDKISTAYLIWKDPLMAAGGDTFINDMMLNAGFSNILAGEERYPEISIDIIKQSGCELLLLSTEPFPFKKKHVAELKEQLPGVKMIIADGQMFSWYGSRLRFSPSYFLELRKELL